MQRILVRDGVSHDLASLLLEDIKNALEFFKNHPVHATLDAAEACGFHQ